MFFFSSRRRHTRCLSDWSSDVCSSDLMVPSAEAKAAAEEDAWKTSGVNRVVNQLQVVPPSKQEAVKAHDASVERAVRKALAGRSERSAASIYVDVENGVDRRLGCVSTE